MKVKITFIILKKDNNVTVTNSNHLKVYLDDEYSFPYKYISTKNEYETLKEISEQHLYVDFDWIKKDLFSFEVLNNQECEVVYVACLPQITDAEKKGSFYTLSELSDIGIELSKNYESAIFRRARSPLGW
tara:strand:- start:156 stop:545 length:390 start_codon:yes stop_codon:yes gene_type:complete